MTQQDHFYFLVVKMAQFIILVKYFVFKKRKKYKNMPTRSSCWYKIYIPVFKLMIPESSLHRKGVYILIRLHAVL